MQTPAALLSQLMQFVVSIKLLLDLLNAHLQLGWGDTVKRYKKSLKGPKKSARAYISNLQTIYVTFTYCH